MFVILWAIVAILAAVASIALTVTATTRAKALRAAVRAIDAEPGRPGFRDGDLAERLSGHPVPAAITVSAGSRRGTVLFAAAAVGLLLTLGALLTDSGFTALVATGSLGLSAYIGLRYGNARRLHANRDRIRLRRWRTSADIPLNAVRGVGLVPARGSSRIWIALWCDPRVVSGLPETLAESATVDEKIGWLRLDPIEAVSTTQLLRLWQFFADRWTIGDENGTAQPLHADLPELFTTAQRFGFDNATGHYRLDGALVGHVVHRTPSRLRWWRAKLTRSVQALPHAFEVRDARLRTRWLISKPDAAWRTAFYVTDRHGHRVGTLRAVSVASRNFDLCGADNRVLATLRPGEPRTTVVDTGGKPIAVWDLRSGDLFSDAVAALRPLCLLSPIVARFAGTANAAGGGNSGSETVALAAEPQPSTDPPPAEAAAPDTTVPLAPATPQPQPLNAPPPTVPTAQDVPASPPPTVSASPDEPPTAPFVGGHAHSQPSPPVAESVAAVTDESEAPAGPPSAVAAAPQTAPVVGHEAEPPDEPRQAEAADDTTVPLAAQPNASASPAAQGHPADIDATQPGAKPAAEPDATGADATVPLTRPAGDPPRPPQS